jgi:hypothetical protein
MSFRHNYPMSTAIVWVYIPEGFAIGADGRRMNGGVVESDETQKIYSVRVGKTKFVYAWCGTTAFELNGSSLGFDEVTDGILLSLDTSRIQSLSDLLTMFTDALHKILLSPIGAVLANVTPDQMPQVLFLGYFQGWPFTAEIHTMRQGTTILRPEIKCAPVSVRVDTFAGSKRVCEEFGERSEPRNLDEAIDLIREYMTRCVAYQGVDEQCSKIGGLVHTGIFRPNGFTWVDYPARRIS